MNPQYECEDIRDELLAAVEQTLIKKKDFQPIGAVKKQEGTIVLTSVNEEGPSDKQSDIGALIRAYKQMARRGEIKACGIAWKTSITDAKGKKKDVIAISLEHRCGYSVIVGEPYKLTLFRKLIKEEIFTQEGRHDVF